MRSHLSEKHSLRLEWMIVILITIEVKEVKQEASKNAAFLKQTFIHALKKNREMFNNECISFVSLVGYVWTRKNDLLNCCSASSYERRMLHCAKALSREGDLDHAECIYSSFVTSATFWKPWIIFKSRISQIVTEDLGCGREQYFTHICSLLLWKKQRKIKVGKKKIFNLLWWSDLYVLGLFFVFMFLIFFLRHEKASMFSCQCQRCIFKRSYLHGKAGTPTPWHWSCSWFKKERGGGGDVEMHPDLLSPKHQL